MPSEEPLPANERLLYFAPNDGESASNLASISLLSDKDDSNHEIKKDGKSNNASSKYICVILFY